uniref:Uncharacterized protein n=1 Tax=Lepeophtheirus salmonis TaxID=72036 RepID=A0A0K2TS03_LEPSM
MLSSSHSEYFSVVLTVYSKQMSLTSSKNEKLTLKTENRGSLMKSQNPDQQLDCCL